MSSVVCIDGICSCCYSVLLDVSQLFSVCWLWSGFILCLFVSYVDERVCAVWACDAHVNLFSVNVRFRDLSVSLMWGFSSRHIHVELMVSASPDTDWNVKTLLLWSCRFTSTVWRPPKREMNVGLCSLWWCSSFRNIISFTLRLWSFRLLWCALRVY